MCFKLLKTDSIYEIINRDSCLCEECQNKLVPYFKRFVVGNCEGLAIYKYDDNIKSLLYQFKGCYDIELAPIFLNRFKNELHISYKGYILIPAPSYDEDDKNREFNHVVEMFKILNLPMYRLVIKTSRFKQAGFASKKRKDAIEHMSVVSYDQIRNKKVLIVDDVMTTGSTLRAMVSLIQKGHPKTIKILVMAKREMK